VIKEQINHIAPYPFKLVADSAPFIYRRHGLIPSRLHNEQTFSPLGMDVIRTTGRLSDVLHRNIPESPGRYYVDHDMAGLEAGVSKWPTHGTS
jgi:hypothetical protein